MKSGFDKNNLDTSVRPGDDFFQFAAGNWLKNNPIPPSETSWNTFTLLNEKSLEALHQILEELSNNTDTLDGEAQKLKNFYQTGMDENKLNRDGISPLREEQKRIESIQNTDDISAMFGHFRLLCISAALSISVELDEKDSSRYMVHIWQNGLGLPDREYYLRQDPVSIELRNKYIVHIARMLGFCGYVPDKALEAANSIMDMEMKMATASTSQEELQQVEKQYHKMPFKELCALAPKINWKRFFDEAGIDNRDEVIVGQPEFLKKIDQLFGDVSVERWQSYLTWKLISGSARFLSNEVVQQHFDFYGTTLVGAKELRPRWKRVVMTVNGLMGEALGKIYIQKHFSEEAKKKINTLVDNIISAYEKRILGLEWMSEETKKKALEKLHKINRKLAYPEKWRNYYLLEVKTDSYLQNYFRAAEFESRRWFAKLDKPVDKQEWFMTPPTVNAYYSCGMNDINFPAGILQPPFFDADASDAANYAAIGSVIGHELSHGFDDQGSKFDGDGNMREWWTDEDRKKFNEKSEVLIKQYDEYIAVDDLHINGKLTLGENIADLGGLCVSFDAFQIATREKSILDKIDGFTPEQLFFLCFAQAEQGHTRPEEQRRLATIDPHSPSRWRINGTVVHMESFYKAFGIKPGDAMYIPPEKRANIW